MPTNTSRIQLQKSTKGTAPRQQESGEVPSGQYTWGAIRSVVKGIEQSHSSQFLLLKSGLIGTVAVVSSQQIGLALTDSEVSVG
jgi:hypothetical protein